MDINSHSNKGRHEAKAAAQRANKRERKKADRKLAPQIKRASAKARYGSAGRPASVVVKSLETGKTLRVVKQAAITEPEPQAAKSRRQRKKHLLGDAPTGLNKRARQLGYESYAHYLRSPHWQRIRQLVLSRDGRRCLDCGGYAGLQVHHLTYERLGSESLVDLATLCTPCHRDVHGR